MTHSSPAIAALANDRLLHAGLLTPVGKTDHPQSANPTRSCAHAADGAGL